MAEEVRVALDRFVYWQTSARPSRDDLQHVLEDYIDESGIISWETDRFFIKLVGRHSEAWRRCEHKDMDAASLRLASARYRAEDRYIEVWIGFDCVDVMTRMADDFTNGVAARLAELLARLWDGKVEAG